LCIDDYSVIIERGLILQVELTLLMIRLNVGGRIFCTTSATLLSIENTFFHALLAGSIPSAKDETGAIFIDRNPRTFALLLELLRTGVLAMVGVC
jgi:hypothetical protein